MKDSSLIVISSSDPFNESKMNEKALTFHTQLHEWSEAQKLSAHAHDHVRLLSNARPKEVFLPIRKLTHIEYWTREVNKYYKPSKNCHIKSGSFMKIDVSKYNMKVSNDKPTRSKSTMIPKSAINRTFRSASMHTTRKRRFFGTDVHTVNNQIIESQLDYSAQRKDIYSTTSTTIKKLNAGITKADTKGADTIQSCWTENGVTDQWDSETLSTLDSTAESKHSNIQTHEHMDKPATENKDISEPVITVRSMSNKMLNVISIDDCKLACRYRPQPIKEVKANGIDYEEIDKQENWSRKQPKKSSAKYKHVKVPPTGDNVAKESVNDADDEADADINVRVNGLHLGKTSSHNNTMTECEPNEYEEQDEEKSQGSDVPNYSVAKEQDETDTSRNSVPDYMPRTETITSGNSEYNPMANITPREQKPQTGTKYISEAVSCDTSKTSYGRITSLYSHSDATKAKPKNRKITRATRINHAIDDMVRARKVMNPIDRDFDNRTAQYGRTVLGKQEGSEHFQKLHTNLRKRIDAFIDCKSAMKTQQYLQKLRKNCTA